LDLVLVTVLTFTWACAEDRRERKKGEQEDKRDAREYEEEKESSIEGRGSEGRTCRRDGAQPEGSANTSLNSSSSPAKTIWLIRTSGE
jgi:hypothetical protein